MVLQFDADLKMVLPELKVVKGTRTDPLFIVGSDGMEPEHPGAWDFLNVGFDPTDKRGVMHFINGEGKIRQVSELTVGCIVRKNPRRHPPRLCVGQIRRRM